jgi:hypothetical protein
VILTIIKSLFENLKTIFMSKKYYKISFFIAFVLLLLLSLWPGQKAHEQNGEVASKLSPKEGDNFKIANQPRVYRLEDGEKRPYLSSVSYLSDSNNAPYGTSYEEGGILICDAVRVAAIPLGEPMPLKATKIAEQKDWKRFLDGDKLGHLVVYLLFSFLMLMAFYQQKKPSIQYLSFACILFSIGLGIELLQANFTESRNFEWEDMMMNSLGIGVAILFFKLSNLTDVIVQ